jgi:septal ring factor EnvC (AmiA/AmiB activator)
MLTCASCGQAFESVEQFTKHSNRCRPSSGRLLEEIEQSRRSARHQHKRLRRDIATLTGAISRLTEQLAAAIETTAGKGAGK